MVKLIFQIAIILAIFKLSEQNSQMCVGRMDGFLFQDDQNCQGYFECQRQQPQRKLCENGYLFNLDLYYCTVAHTVNCRNRHNGLGRNDPSNVALESHHSICRNQRNGVKFENSQNCRAFIECNNNFRLDRECDIGELFEATSKQCMSDLVVNCGSRPILMDTNNHVEINQLCSHENQLIPHPIECQMYIECRDNMASIRTCPPNTLFELNSRMCINDFLVNCGRRQNRNQNHQEIIAESLIDNICHNLPDGTRISNPENCNTFFECRNRRKIEVSCPTRTKFDVNLNQCRDESSVTCLSTNSAVDSGICQGQPNGQRFHNPLNCAEYFECQNNQRMGKSCNNGQLFSQQFLTCVPYSAANCGSRRIPETSRPQQNGISVPCENPGIYIRAHPLPCQSTYFICINGNMMQHACANGIVFNPDTLQCDFARNTGCDLIRTPQIPRIGIDCSSQRFSPHLTNCNQYFICINGIPQLMTCPFNQIWNNNRAKCEVISFDNECNGRIV